MESWLMIKHKSVHSLIGGIHIHVDCHLFKGIIHPNIKNIMLFQSIMLFYVLSNIKAEFFLFHTMTVHNDHNCQALKFLLFCFTEKTLYHTGLFWIFFDWLISQALYCTFLKCLMSLCFSSYSILKLSSSLF